VAATLKLALLQLASHGTDVAANLRKAQDYCRRSAREGADLALFPELWSIGYRGFDPSEAGARERWAALAVEPDGAFASSFGALARELGMAIAITQLERGPGAPRNALALFDRYGARVLDYAKVHLCPWGPPDAACAPGEGFPVCTLDTAAGPVRLGAMTCFDREFPESARMLMLDGAELILTPNACTLVDDAELGDVRLAQFRARAFENLVAVAMANYAAPEFDGNSVAYYPDGSEIVRGGRDEELVLASIDLERVRAFRRREEGRDAARRPDRYTSIAAPDHPRPLGRTP
jgi:predicted amidohydrolase